LSRQLQKGSYEHVGIYFSAYPGASNFGSQLIAIGVAISALFMIFVF
jgi:hypothetical protein